MANIRDPVYHYTSLATFQKIVEGKQLRLSNVFFMNDSMEVRWFEQHVAEVTRFIKGFPGWKADGNSSFFRRLMELLDRHQDFGNLYCCCFSAEDDDLSQWRGYADDGRGVAIGLSLEQLLAEQRDLKPICVEYDSSDEKLRDEVEKCIQHAVNSRANPETAAESAFILIRSLAVQFKNPKFHAEQEMRLVLQGADSSFPINHQSEEFVDMRGRLDFNHRDGVLVPYTTIELPLTSIETVMLGPRFGGPHCEKSLRLFLSKYEINADVTRSEASYCGSDLR